jgi:hypothetical protein
MERYYSQGTHMYKWHRLSRLRTLSGVSSWSTRPMRWALEHEVDPSVPHHALHLDLHPDPFAWIVHSKPNTAVQSRYVRKWSPRFAATNPQPLPPEPVATRSAAHLPTEQQPLAQSPSPPQSPVMNCVPGGLPEPIDAAGEALATGAAAAAFTPGAASAFGPAIFCAALLFGDASPKPHPPSRSCAMTAPAHLPDLKPQHPDTQSASLLHAPVMNCEPGAIAGDVGADAGAAPVVGAEAGAGAASAATAPAVSPLTPGAACVC